MVKTYNIEAVRKALTDRCRDGRLELSMKTGHKIRIELSNALGKPVGLEDKDMLVIDVLVTDERGAKDICLTHALCLATCSKINDGDASHDDPEDIARTLANWECLVDETAYAAKEACILAEGAKQAGKGKQGKEWKQFRKLYSQLTGDLPKDWDDRMVLERSANVSFVGTQE